MPLSVADNENNVSFDLMFYYIIFSKVALIRYKRFYAGDLHFYIDIIFGLSSSKNMQFLKLFVITSLDHSYVSCNSDF